MLRYVTFPRLDKGSPPPGGRLEPSKILIADDSPLVLRMIEKMMTEAGLHVLTARDGLEALDKAVSEDVDLVILDVMMPRMNGYQACRLLKSEPSTRGVPVIILTSKDQEGDRFWGLETGADYYITKDSEPHRILDLVKNVLAGEGARPRAQPGEVRRSSLDILSNVNDLLDRKLYEATILSEIGRVTRGLVEFDYTFTAVMNLVGRVVDFSVGAMAFVEEDELDVVLMLRRPATPAVVEEVKARLVDAVVREHGGAAFARVQARLFTPTEGPAGPEEKTLEGFVGVPVTTNDRVAGLLAIGGRRVARMNAETEAFLAQVANQAYIVLENSRLFARVRNLSVRDSLTDLFNHRHVMELVSLEFSRVGRYPDAFSILMIDVDDFKKVNDEFGHPAGDAVLKDLAGIIKEAVRTVDVVGRYGGEEFVALLPHTTHAEALETAERVRQRIHDHLFPAGDKKVHVTVSVGVASYPSANVDSPSTLVREADQALYRAKEAGRNRVA
jgi:two-component system, cell cycle response regulator